MNIFRFAGDMSHILSFIILLHKIIKGKSTVGISLRTQELYAGAQELSARASRHDSRPQASARRARGHTPRRPAGHWERAPPLGPPVLPAAAKHQRCRRASARCLLTCASPARSGLLQPIH